MTEPVNPEEARAAKRYLIMNGVRIVALAAVLLGLAIARSVIEAPYALGVALALTGLIAFFFAPRQLAKSWKAKDREQQ